MWERSKVISTSDPLMAGASQAPNQFDEGKWSRWFLVLDRPLGEARRPGLKRKARAEPFRLRQQFESPSKMTLGRWEEGLPSRGVRLESGVVTSPS